MERRAAAPRPLAPLEPPPTPARVGGLDGDRGSVCLLLFLYVLQGVPLGLAGSIPMVLQGRRAGYREQALFSLVSWPFSLKLLWAPLVDSLFWGRLGRRKSWLVPAQYLIGLSMLLLSSRVPALLGEGGGHPDVHTLTVLFFCINALAATQDIAVDGWALTMLSRRNVSYASTCNSVGQTAGYFLGNVVFLALESAAFCNKYLRTVPQDEGVVTLPGFLQFWGVAFLVTTTLVMFLKAEGAEEGGTSPVEGSGIRDTYLKLYRILCLRNMWLMLAFLLTCKVAFAAADAVTGLKLMEAGVRKENLALFAVPMVPLQVLLPFLIARYTAGPRPLSLFLTAYPFRLIFGLLFPALVWWTHRVRLESGGFPAYYYVVILSAFILQQVTVYSQFVALMSFFAAVSDPSIGGTYMTLLNTLCNLGGNWPSTAALWAVDALTLRACVPGGDDCSAAPLAERCEASGGVCTIWADGYHVEAAACTLFGLLWLRWGRSAVRRLQALPPSAWRPPRPSGGERTQ